MPTVINRPSRLKELTGRLKKPIKRVTTPRRMSLALDVAIKTKIQKYLNLGVPKSDIALMIPGWNLNGHGEMAQQFLLLSAPGKDIDAEPEEKYDTSPVLPEDAWTGLFAKYRALVAGTTEASDNYHFGGFLTILGTTLKHTRVGILRWPALSELLCLQHRTFRRNTQNDGG